MAGAVLRRGWLGGRGDVEEREGECLAHTVKRLEIVETCSGCHGVGSRMGSVYTRDGGAE